MSRLRTQLGAEIVPGRKWDDRTAGDGGTPVRLLDTLTDLDVFETIAALAADDVATARIAASRALVGLPGNEVLYRARMRIEAQAGNRAGVRSVYAEMLAVLGGLGGAAHDAGDPSPVTRQLFEQLVNSDGRGEQTT